MKSSKMHFYGVGIRTPKIQMKSSKMYFHGVGIRTKNYLKHLVFEIRDRFIWKPSQFMHHDIARLSNSLIKFDTLEFTGFWEHLQQIKTVTTTFVQATFVHISKISAFTDSIWTKLKRQVPGTIITRCKFSLWLFSRQHMSWGHLSISAISQLLLARFGSNFKQRVLGTYTTDYNCHHDICPYQQYTSPSWTLSTSVLF